MTMLDLEEPRAEEPEDPSRPSLRLVPRGPGVAFHWVEEPETPWRVRALSILLAVILTTAGVATILFTAEMLKQAYDRMDAVDQARAVERARQRAAREAASKPRDDGAVVLTLPREKPKDPPAPGSN